MYSDSCCPQINLVDLLGIFSIEDSYEDIELYLAQNGYIITNRERFYFELKMASDSLKYAFI